METAIPALPPGFSLYDKKRSGGHHIGPPGIRIAATRKMIQTCGDVYEHMRGHRAIVATDDERKRVAIRRAADDEPGPKVTTNTISFAWAKRNNIAPGFYPAEFADGWWVVTFKKEDA